MDEKPIFPVSENASKIADAAALFRDEEHGTKPAATPRDATMNASDVGYEVEPAAVAETPRPGPLRTATAKAKKPAAPKPETRTAREPSETVTEIWTRGAEWGQTIKILAATGIGVFCLFFVLFYASQYGLAFLLILIGAASSAILSYPILITLERPVRITPEQAVRDYYAAISHHFPHFRRMWLLLSDEGKISGQFASLEGFSAYWKGRLAELKGNRVSKFTPLKFKVEDFRSEQSAGKTEVDASYTVTVTIRGKADEGPIENVRVNTTLVRGPDNMWYLDLGTLP